nr:5-guanidino-2-oxopentanoate decarboxylase [uncultured Halomonas sp.]
MNCAEWLVDLLEHTYGVDTICGIPGVHTVQMYRGVATSGIRHVTPRHEQGAGFMADGYARANGKPGVCFIITGPGMTNITTAMAQAYADSIPMLVISSVNPRDQLALGEGRLHELPNQQQLVAGLCAFSHTLMDAKNLPKVLDRAFSVFQGGRPRPVHIEIPLDVIVQEVPKELLSHRWRSPTPIAAPSTVVNEALDWLQGAKRPWLLVGGGALAAGEQVRALAECLGLPVFTTVNAKGLMPAGHPLNMGSTQSYECVLREAPEADVVLAIGTELGETDYDVSFQDRFRIAGRLIRVDVESAQLYRNQAPDLAIHADAATFIDQLLERAHQTQTRRAADETGIAKLKQEIDRETPAEWKAVSRLMESVYEVLPDAVMVGDSTEPVYVGNMTVQPNTPRRWFNSSTGYGTLGYALPAAIGARLARPDLPVLAIVGDGGFLFTLSELATAVEAKVGLIVLLWNNSGYGEIRKYMDDHDVQRVGVDLWMPDFEPITQGFGCRHDHVTGPDGLKELLHDGAPADRPWIIEIDQAAWMDACAEK